MASLFFAMVSDSWVWSAMLIVGVVLGILGTIAYARTGLRELAAGLTSYRPRRPCNPSTEPSSRG